MRSTLRALALSAVTLVAVAGCVDDSSPALDKDAAVRMDSGGRDPIAAPSVDLVPQPPPWARRHWQPPVDAGPAPICAKVGDGCGDLPCCAPSVCIDYIYTSVCESGIDPARCSPEGAPCSLGVACCPGTVCVPGGFGLTCTLAGGPDAPAMCGGLGAPCELMPCCPGLHCAPRGSGTYCLDRG